MPIMSDSGEAEERKRKRRHKHKSRDADKRADSSDSDDNERIKKKKKEKKKEKKRRREEERQEICEPSSSKKKKKKEKDREDEREKKRVKDTMTKDAEIPQSSVSANAWEKVDLGDTERKEKFLRLMGASRQASNEQTVHVVHNAAGENTKHLSEDMERQFKAGIDQRYQRHSGLGFSQGPSGDQAAFGEPSQSGSSRLDEMKKKFSMNFVKSSNS